MPQTVNVPGVGQLQFPDGMSQTDMASAIQRNFPQIHAPSAADQIPLPAGAAQRMQAEAAAQPPQREPSFLDKVTGGIEAARSTVTGMTSGALGYMGGALGGIAGSIANGDFGTEKGTRLAKEAAEQGAASLTYEPKTELGQQYVKKIGDALESSGIVGVPIPEIEALARALPITRNRIPGPVMRDAAPAIDYDIPAYQRNGVRPPPEIAGPPEPPIMVGPPAPPEIIGPPAPPPMVGPPRIEDVFGIHVPEASKGPVWPPQRQAAPLDSFATNPSPSPYGALSEPIAPAARLSSALDQYAANPVDTARRAVPNQFDDMLREAPAAAPMKSPLDSMIAGESAPAQRITAGLRDTSDIDATLAAFGVKAPEGPAMPTPRMPIAGAPADYSAIEGAPMSLRDLISAIDRTREAPIPGPHAIPAETVPRATAPVAPIDSGLVVPEPIPGPGRPTPTAEVVEQAKTPIAPIDDSMRVPATEAEQPFVPTPEQHVDPAKREQHLQVLREIGLENKRESAVTGNAAQAAREYQMGKFDEPAGHHWDAQFRAETDAMKNYANKIVDDTRGRTGLDSEALEAKGRDIAAPYDAARKYFEDAKAELYAQADQAAAGKPLPSTDNIDGLFVDRSFNNAALADDQMNLVSAAKNQFELHKERNGGGITVKDAEDYRKWLNQRWTPANSKIVGEIKGALDKDVFSAAGDDIYAAARRLHQEEMRVLDDPTGISKLFDSDPRTPINRATPYENIPNGLIKLSNEQFKHIIDTYRNLPPELQPLAQQAIATMKAHYAERMANAGVETAKGNPRGLWDTGGVRTFAERNSAKLPLIFDPSEMQKIGMLLQAGEILRTNPSYPGAGAQVANATKAGMMSHIAGKVTGGVGSAIGAVFGGPWGAGAGAVAGDAVGTGISNLARERRALAAAKKQIINEHSAAPKPRSPMDEWEAGLR